MRKYPKVTGYWMYVHRTPDNFFYVGISKTQVCKRWQPYKYKTMSIYPYIEQYGWDNIEHLVVKDSLTKEQALYWEDQLIQLYSQMGCLINNNRSGNCTADIQQYNRQYEQRPERKEYQRQYEQRPKRKQYKRQFMREYDQQLLSTPEYKIYNRVKAYNHYHPDKVIETPMEAKQKFLESGYIPSYIKSDDLI